ncbi:MAG TPA: hypothetical protein VFY79_02965 [Dehalococcoidia bacterium]|nr:hypothetical protein [Dehalococcoidia bacterium]
MAGKASKQSRAAFHDPREKLDRLIERFDAGESVWSDEDEVIELEFKKPLDKVIPIRFSDAHWRALYAEAQALGLGPSTLARMWVIERLRTLPARKQRAAAPPARKPRASSASPAGKSRPRPRRSA